MKISPSILTGISFGLTSATITTLGLMVGLNSTTHSQTVVLGGIITIAIADAMSDSLGIHVSEESKRDENTNLWEATLATFFSKFLFGLTFAIPVLLIELETAVLASIAWGIVILSILSYYIARSNNDPPLHAIGEHLLIAIIVIFISNLVGEQISLNFG